MESFLVLMENREHSQAEPLLVLPHPLGQPHKSVPQNSPHWGKLCPPSSLDAIVLSKMNTLRSWFFLLP